MRTLASLRTRSPHISPHLPHSPAPPGPWSVDAIFLSYGLVVCHHAIRATTPLVARGMHLLSISLVTRGSYNTLAGGVLTGKYLDVPASPDDPNKARAFFHSRHTSTPPMGDTCHALPC